MCIYIHISNYINFGVDRIEQMTIYFYEGWQTRSISRMIRNQQQYQQTWTFEFDFEVEHIQHILRDVDSAATPIWGSKF